MKLTAMVVALASTLVQCQEVVPSEEDLKAIAEHLAKPPSTLSDKSIIKKLTIDMDDLEGLQRILDKILVVRVAGTTQIKEVEKFIKKAMERLNWHVSTDEFEQNTVIGPKNFSNIIATLNPEAPRRLIIACHYDSKLTPKGFLGAIDSALPCAQMINLADVMKKELDAHNRSALGKKLTLQFVFFDGEESFLQWEYGDNTYGSRHLAKIWEKKDILKGIEVLMLLDLLGSKEPAIFPLDEYQSVLHSWWKKLIEYESIVIKQNSTLPKSRIFQPHPGPVAEDDHIPFLKRHVPILHLIAFAGDPPRGFPPVWHTMNDTIDAMDWPTVTKLNHIFRLFVGQYLELFSQPHQQRLDPLLTSLLISHNITRFL